VPKRKKSLKYGQEEDEELETASNETPRAVNLLN